MRLATPPTKSEDRSDSIVDDLRLKESIMIANHQH